MLHFFSGAKYFRYLVPSFLVYPEAEGGWYWELMIVPVVIGALIGFFIGWFISFVPKLRFLYGKRS